MQVLVLCRDCYHRADGNRIDLGSLMQLKSVLFGEWVCHWISWAEPNYYHVDVN